MKNVHIAVIPAAGLGTRFLPATKALPKEMLPIIDIPTIQYIVQETLQSGIDRVILIISHNKEAIKKHFEINEEYESFLRKEGKNNLADLLNDFAKKVHVEYVLQVEQKGLGHAIYQVKDVVKDEPFAVLLGDDLVINEDGETATKQLIKAYEKTSSTILGVQKVPLSEVSKYGIVAPKNSDYQGRLVELKGMVEKPLKEDSPSDLAALGRYVLTPDIFKALEKTKPGKGGEIQLTDAICSLMENKKVYAYDFEGIRYDVGDKFGYVKAVIDFSLKRDDLKEKVLNHLKTIDY